VTPGVGNYLVVSAAMFTIGLVGVIVRRSPLVVLLSLELMLNAGNLVLVAFGRYHGGQDGQIFALVVMGVAAAEVVLGLGLIVAMERRRMLLDTDELTELAG
jgi:NADH-quinone oxidoreductase subunit K